MQNNTLERKVFLGLLLFVTLAFGWILLPFYGAVFWAAILAIIFAPLQKRLANHFGERRNLAALLTLTVCLLVAVLPVILIAAMLVQEGATLYQQIESGDLDVRALLNQFRELLPAVAQQQLDRLGWGDAGSLRERLASGALEASRYLAADFGAS